MTKTEFVNLLGDYLDETGMSDGAYNVFFSVGDNENINTTIYIDKENFIFVNMLWYLIHPIYVHFLIVRQ